MPCLPSLANVSKIFNNLLFVVCNISTVGGFFAGLPFGYIVKRLGWNYAFLILEFISVVNVLISSFLLLRNNMKNNCNNAIDNEIAKKQR